MGFKDQMEKDLNDVFFNEEEFSVLATFRGLSITVDFKEKDEVVFDSGLDSDVSASVPTALCKNKDVSDVEKDEELVVDGVTYYIIDIDPPSDGIRRLYLSEDRP